MSRNSLLEAGAKSEGNWTAKGSYRVWIHFETRTWHDKNIQSSISTLRVKVMTCFFQNNPSHVLWKIFKNWDSLNIWELLNIYNTPIQPMLWIKFRSLSVCWTLELGKTQSKYFVLVFYGNHGIFGKNLHKQRFLLNWISCFRVKSS